MIFQKKHCYVVMLLLLQSSCAPKAPFVWVENLPVTDQKVSPYLIQPGDEVEVSVWNQTQISGRYPVREDGFITVPLVGDVQVSGTTAVDAAGAIAEKLVEGGIVQDVRVVVISRAVTPQYVSVLGEVNRPGQYELKPRDNILDVLALAGGLNDFADEDSIYVFRRSAPNPLIRFDYSRLTSYTRCGIRFKLQHGDVIIVQ